MTLLGALRGKCTIILIGHRSSALSGCDLLFELDGGRLVGRKTLAELALGAPRAKLRADERQLREIPSASATRAPLRARMTCSAASSRSKAPTQSSARARRRGFRRLAEASTRSSTAPIHRAARAHRSPADVGANGSAPPSRPFSAPARACSAQPSTRAPSPSWTPPSRARSSAFRKRCCGSATMLVTSSSSSRS